MDLRDELRGRFTTAPKMLSVPMPRPTPTYSRPVDLPWTPTELAKRWPSADRLVAMISADDVDGRYAAWSLIGLARPQSTSQTTRNASEIQARADTEPSQALDHLQKQITEQPDALWVGYLSYDLGRRLEPGPSASLQSAGTNGSTDDRHWPAMSFHRLDGYLLYDHVHKTWLACDAWASMDWVCPAVIDQAVGEQAKQHNGSGDTDHEYPPPAPSLAEAKRAYPTAVRQAKAFIAAGDVFQVNLAHRLSLETHVTPRSLFDAWNAENPAWYSAYFPFTDEAGRRRVIVSGSPELFFEREGDRIRTRPIKGTRPAEADPSLLKDSPKDAAELHMIVDLMRNDLGRVCRYGTVRVTEARQIESHPTVHHGVATIDGRLKPGIDLAQLLSAVMPGGSVTGAPKVRAMQIIESLEPVRRGPYCGAIGWIQGESAVFNIAIRTACFTESAAGDNDTPGRWRLDYGVGSGIVADSEPDAEYAETLTKARAFLQALAQASSLPSNDAVSSIGCVSETITE